MNEHDSEIMEHLLTARGYILTPDMESADLVLLNTCSIRAKAEQKVFSLLGQLRLQKEQQPGLRVGVAGCVAQQEGRKIFTRMPHVDLVIGTQQFYQLPEMLMRLDAGETSRELACDLDQSFTLPPFQKLSNSASQKQQPPCPAPRSSEKNKNIKKSTFRKFVTIMQGCNNFCSYCVVPHTRGREISRPVTDILEEVSILANQGVKEITLLGQNVNSYGCANPVADKPAGFADLVRLVAEIPGIARIRFTSSNPQDLSVGLMQCFRDLDNLCPHFHLPVQSGSNAVLAKMNRKYTRELYLEKVENLRSFCSEIAISTDIIVGFPGETGQDFEQTMDLLKTVRFHGSFSFKYSDRPNTRSATFPDKVDEDVKGKRLRQFQQRQDQISLERNQEMVGRTIRVMVERNEAGTIQARTGSNHIVHFKCPDQLLPGDMLDVRLTRAGKHSLQGEVA